MRDLRREGEIRRKIHRETGKLTEGEIHRPIDRGRKWRKERREKVEGGGN